MTKHATKDAEWIIDIFAEMIGEPAVQVWRKGAKISRDNPNSDQPIATCATEELAHQIVDEHNIAIARRADGNTKTNQDHQ